VYATCIVCTHIQDSLFHAVRDRTPADKMEESIFFDRSPRYFTVILDFLRNSKAHLELPPELTWEGLTLECSYYGVTGLPLKYELVDVER
jgi:hypothetical protein